jgi:hypothetical protein
VDHGKGGSCNGDVIPGSCSVAGLLLGVRRGQLRGAEPRGQAEGSSFLPRATGEEKDGRANESELLVDASSS